MNDSAREKQLNPENGMGIQQVESSLSNLDKDIARIKHEQRMRLIKAGLLIGGIGLGAGIIYKGHKHELGRLQPIFNDVTQAIKKADYAIEGIKMTPQEKIKDTINNIKDRARPKIDNIKKLYEKRTVAEHFEKLNAGRPKI